MNTVTFAADAAAATATATRFHIMLKQGLLLFASSYKVFLIAMSQLGLRFTRRHPKGIR